MIVKISGKLVEKKENSLTVDIQGLFYEIIVPPSVLQRIEDTIDYIYIDLATDIDSFLTLSEKKKILDKVLKFGFEYCSLDPTVKVGSGYCSNCKYCIECSTDGSWIKCKKLVS